MNNLKISGTIEKIVYQSTSSWYSVCDVCLDTGEMVTVVGIMPYASVGEGIEAMGEFVTNKDYGKQFKVEEYTKLMPQKKNAILRYLSSGAIKGIGAKIAKKIVDLYGEDSFDVIENHPDWLAQINGISRKKAYEISFDFKEKSDVREIMTISSGLVSVESAVKIYKRLGKNATRDGHTYVNKDTLVDSVSKYIGVEIEKIKAVLEHEEGIKGISMFLCENVPCVALSELYFAEINISKRLKHINRKAIALENANLEYVVSNLEDRDSIKYAVLQKKAIYEALKNGVMVLTGGPGTGKTTVIKALLKIFSNLGMSCALCAPTGRASKRMSEATGDESKTIHRLLEVATGNELSDEPKFARNNSNPLDEDVIIVDEASMIDVPLMNSLLNAIKTGARLILIGDVSQLPSVGEGDVLNDIISSGEFSVVCLNEIFRQAENSGIVTNAHKINKGICPNVSDKFDDFFFIEKDEEITPEFILDLCKNRLPRKYGAEIADNIQIITPSKKGASGTINLNYILQAGINPHSPDKKQISKGQSKAFRVGDKVMQTKNNYDIEWVDNKNGIELLGTGIFNGDVGIIKSISDDAVVVDYQGKRVEYANGELDELEHSYAITVHKSQGSEYPIVIIPITKSCPYMLLTRNLIYTAITRAEKMAIIIGDKDVFYQMVENNVKISRNTMLKRLLNRGEL